MANPASEVERPDHRPLGRFRYLALAAAIMTYLLIVMGGIVRVTGSGLGCPDWPTCYGQWIPPLRMDAILEYLHRLFATFASPLILAAAIVAVWRHWRTRWLSRPLAWAVGLLVFQALLGGVVVLMETPPEMVAVHLALALVILGLLLVSTVFAFARRHNPAQPDRLRFRSPFARLTLWALVVTFIVLVSGALVAGSGSTFACVGWPLCNGQFIPGTSQAWIHWGHRLLVGGASVLMLVLLVRAWRSQRTQRAVLSAATVTVILFFAQGLVGALKVTQGFPVYLLGLHVATAAAVWAALVVLVALVGLAGRSPEEERLEAAQPIDAKQRASDLFSLTKPIIVALLLVTTYAGMVVAGGALPSLSVTFWTLLAGAMAAGGSSAVNMYIDRELDQYMARTAKRPIAAGRMTPAEGLAFGLGLLVVSFYLMAGFVNLLAALLALAGMLYYVLLYSIFLKKATVQNIVIGGGAGALPPLVGWAAVTGSLAVPALFLFAIVFMWTPPHFWALALVRKKDYERAGIPMLPVVRGRLETRWKILIYTLELVGVTLLMAFLNLAGSIFLVAALLLGGMLISAAWRVWRKGGNKLAWRMYRYSSMYLALIFVALMVDALL